VRVTEKLNSTMEMILTKREKEIREKEIREQELIRIEKARKHMIGEDGFFKLKLPDKFNLLLGYGDGGAYSRIYVPETLEMPRVTTKRVRV